MTKIFPNPQIVVLDRGFIYVGRVAIDDGFLTISRASTVRRWGTSNGLGELASKGPQPRTSLDAVGSVVAPMGSVIQLIDCEPAAWPALAATDLAA